MGRNSSPFRPPWEIGLIISWIASILIYGAAVVVGMPPSLDNYLLCLLTAVILVIVIPWIFFWLD